MRPHTPAIDAFCEERRLSRAKLAAAIGISAPYWTQILNGQRPAKAWMLLRAAEVLRVSVEAISIPDPGSEVPKGKRPS